MRREPQNTARFRLRLTLLFVCVAGLMGLAPATASGAVFFSEYVEGTNINKALEIYNSSNAPVDLAAGGYEIRIYQNGGAAPAPITLPLNGTLSARDVLVIVNSSADPALLALADVSTSATPLFFNGNDALELISSAGTVDTIGQIGFDPSPPGYWGTEPVTTLNHTLRRKSTVISGDPNGADAFDPAVQWDGYVTDDFTGLGSHTIDSDSDGVNDPADNCATTANANQVNLDGDALGDACDPDIDNDGSANASDACPGGAVGAGGDLDGDGCKASEDADDDGDGTADASDACTGLAGTASGCPRSTRSLTLKRASRRKLKGTLRSPAIPACRAGQKLNVMRKTRRGARKVRTLTTRATGAFAAGNLRPGRYFVKAPSRLIPNVGFCAAAKSKIVRLP